MIRVLAEVVRSTRNAVVRINKLLRWEVRTSHFSYDTTVSKKRQSHTQNEEGEDDEKSY